jgi:hypothetical protein
MLQTVQLSIADCGYAAELREALSRSCAWRVETVDRPDQSQSSVLVLDETAFERLPLPLSNPERVVLITRNDPELLARAWEAGIVSVVVQADSTNTVLLAIMAAALRIDKFHEDRFPEPEASGFSPIPRHPSAPISPQSGTSPSKRWKIQ